MPRTQVVAVPAGSEGVDFAAWRPPSLIIRQWAYVLRYIGAGSAWKLLTPIEIGVYHSAGVAIVMTLEQAADSWTHGATLGAAHGKVAAIAAARLGYPKGLPIPFAYDTNVAPGDVRALQYGEAAADAVEAAGYTFGVYGDLDVIRMLAHRSKLNWLAGALSWSDPTRPYQPELMPGYDLVHVRQVISGSTPNYDRNVTLRPFLAWLPNDGGNTPIEVDQPDIPRPTTPTTPIEEDDMPTKFVADSQSKGSAVVTLTQDLDGNPHYSMVGFNDPVTALAWRSALPHQTFSDADYLALAAGASK